MGKVALLLIAGIVIAGAYFYFRKGKGLGSILPSGSGSDISDSSNTMLTVPTAPAGFRSHNIIGVNKGCAPYDIECLQQQQLVDTSGH